MSTLGGQQWIPPPRAVASSPFPGTNCRPAAVVAGAAVAERAWLEARADNPIDTHSYCHMIVSISWGMPSLFQLWFTFIFPCIISIISNMLIDFASFHFRQKNWSIDREFVYARERTNPSTNPNPNPTEPVRPLIAPLIVHWHWAPSETWLRLCSCR